MEKKMSIVDIKKTLFSKSMLDLKKKDILLLFIVLIVIVLGHVLKIGINLFYLMVPVFFIYWFITIKHCVKLETIEYDKERVKLLVDGEVVGDYIPSEDVKPLLKVSKAIFWDRFILIFVFIFLWFAGYAVYDNVETKEFLENAGSTIGIIESVDKDMKIDTEYDDGDIEKTYRVSFSYKVSYSVDDVNYEYKFKNEKSYSNKRQANEAKAVYAERDEIEIYYQKDNPRDVRHYVELISTMFINISLGFVYGTQLLALVILKRKYTKDCEKVEFGLN